MTTQTYVSNDVFSNRRPPYHNTTEPSVNNAHANNPVSIRARSVTPMHCTYNDTGFPTQIADISTHQLSCASHPPGFYALKRHNTSNSIIQQQRLKNSHYNYTFYTPFHEPGAQQRRFAPAKEHQLSCASYLRRLYARTTQHRYTARHNNPEIEQLS